MKRIILAVFAAIVLAVPVYGDDKKLPKEDFNLNRKVEKLELDVVAIKAEIEDLKRRLNKVEKVAPEVAPAPRACQCKDNCKCLSGVLTCDDGNCPAVKPKKFDPYGLEKYDDFCKQLAVGARGILVVGIEDKYVGSYQIHCRVASGFGSLADGEYDCWHENGKWLMTLRVPAVSKQQIVIHSQYTFPAQNCSPFK